MPIATPEQFRDMIDKARRDGFAYPAINVTSSQTLNAALRGFVESRSDGIIEITTGAATYLSGPTGDMAAGAHAFANFVHRIAEDLPVFIGLHTDHCQPEDVDRFLVPLLTESALRFARGEPPLFNSHMFDGSELPLRDSLAVARRLLDAAAEIGVVMEFEIGLVGGEEDGVDHNGTERTKLYSTPGDAIAVAETLGTGEHGRYLLAATFGNVHGHYAPGHVKLRPELLADLQRAVRNGDGRHFDFVFHGGSGSSLEDIGVALENGVVKLNVDTDMQQAFSGTIEKHFRAAAGTRTESQIVVDKRLYDPRSWGRAAEKEMAELVSRYAIDLGSAGRTLAGSEPSA
jgi:fructose-bisphosphate aldolase class II